MIQLSKPFFDESEKNAVAKVLESGWVSGQGPKCIELSDIIRSITESKYAIPVNNCTAGLHLALLALGIKDGDEVLVSDFTFPATGHAVLYCGATPRFVDVELKSYNIDPKKIEEKCNNRTKAIIVVHAFGHMADMHPILEIAKRKNIQIIEDAACSLHAKYKGHFAGAFGSITSFSFHGRKNITSGEGGVVISNNEEYADKINLLSCFGMESAYNRQDTFNIPIFQVLGYNYKLSDINASIVIEQLKKYPKFIKKKKKLVLYYNELFYGYDYLSIPFVDMECEHVYQSYVVRLDEKINRNALIVSLFGDRIQTQIGYYASHLQPVYNSSDICPNSKLLFDQTLALPMFYNLTYKNIKYIVERLAFHIEKQLKIQ